MQDFSRESYRLIPQYLPHYAKMMEDKDIDTRALMAEAFSVAVQVLARFDGIEPHEVVASVYVFCKDEKYKFISRYFESCVESAALTPDAFAKGLHKWCNALAAKIKNTEGGLKAFAEFASLYRRLQTQKAEAMNIDERVVNAYIDLICLLLSYVRPQKLDSTKALCGVTTDGKGMTIHDPYALSLLPTWEITCIANGIRGYKNLYPNGVDFGTVHRKYGFYNVETPEDVQTLNQQLRYFQNMRLSMLPYINEYTYDIMPQHQFTCNVKSLMLCDTKLDVAKLREKLHTSRRRTLASNGITVVFNDPSTFLRSLLLKEMVVDDEVILLYRLSINEIGDIVGYYNTNLDYLCSPTEVNANHPVSKYIDALVLYFYAVAVLDDDEYTDEKAPSYFTNFIYPLEAISYGRSGHIAITYPPLMSTEEKTGPRHDPTKYEEKERSINGYIRKLPAGQVASDEARAKAKKMGYDLKTDETYVSPFMRRTFYLKDKENDGPKDEEKNDNSKK